MAINIKMLKPVKSRLVSAEEFRTLASTQRSNIEASAFIMPKLGEKGFGKFKVTFKDKVLFYGTP
jgi:hypothetical protein